LYAARRGTIEWRPFGSRRAQSNYAFLDLSVAMQ
jgi:hypothetical protein